MRSRNNYSGLDPEIVKQLKYHAWRLKQMKCFESQEIEDIEQDLLLEIWPALSKFDRTKSSLATFVDKLLSRRSNNLIHKHMCIKRGGKTQTLSLDKEDENGQTLMDYLADDHCFEDEISIRIDVSKVIHQLPESLQTLCEQLKIFTITEVSHMSGRSRAAIYRDLELMRPMFFPTSVYIRRCEQFFPQCGI